MLFRSPSPEVPPIEPEYYWNVIGDIGYLNGDIQNVVEFVANNYPGLGQIPG